MIEPTSVEFNSLSDRYSLTSGAIPLSGIQGIVRSIIDARRADISAGLKSRVYISGYQGSPLGGLDTEIVRAKKILDPLGILLHPGLNEELAATALAGTQLLEGIAKKDIDGVTGFWYGKSPGVDRAADAIRHANLIGTHSNGGVVLLAGDDPAAKSSTVPGSSDATLASLGLPVFFPGNTKEMLTLTRHAILASRASGLWCGFKVVTKVADSTGVFVVPDDLIVDIPILEWRNRPYRHKPSAHLLGPALLEMEETLTGVRLDIFREYIYRNKLNLVFGSKDAKLGIIAVGTTYFDLMQALGGLGLRDHGLLRIMKLVVSSPLEKRELREFASGLTEILVLEEKGPFVERMVKEDLYATANAPIVTGKRDPYDKPLVPPYGSLEADDIAQIVAKRFNEYGVARSVENRLSVLESIANRRMPSIEQRTPFFCSGCPHNTSTAADDNTIVGAGIGCHTLVLTNPKGRGKIAGVTQMGGEGAQFIGMAPFTDHKHFVQNIGDGTFHHSGSLAIRAAVAAGINITYKILYNDAVAMTGGQAVEGQLSIPDMVQYLYLEGVSLVAITTDEPSKYRGIELPRQAKVYDRSELPKVEKELSNVNGVSIIIHDQLCAIEKRRRRRTKAIPAPDHLVIINERICEGCGDCGEKSNCLSVEPVETFYGRKTRINQGSCSFDKSCLKGDCPAFLLVDPAKGQANPRPQLPDLILETPKPRVNPDSTSIRLIGIGGTGVVTVAAVIGIAALLDRKFTRGLDQTGLSQKAGPVISDIHISTKESIGSAPIPSGDADVIIGFDLFGTASEKNIRVSDPNKTVAVISIDEIPTGLQVTDATHNPPSQVDALEAISTFTDKEQLFLLPAQSLAQSIFNDQLPANVILLGAAWQLGLIPVSLASLSQAFKLNAVGVAQNQEAFTWGRISVVRPEITNNILDPKIETAKPSKSALKLVKASNLLDGKTGELLATLSDELCRYQNRRYVKTFLDETSQVAILSKEKLTDPELMIQEFAKNLFKLMAYKDEYEVARLHLVWKNTMADSTKYSMLLHPPMLRALGLKRKIQLKKSADPSMKLLARMKFLRGGLLDIFGHTKLRRWEAAAGSIYAKSIKQALSSAGDEQVEQILRLVNMPDMVRGYEGIKLGNINKYESMLSQELKTLLDGSGRATPI